MSERQAVALGERLRDRLSCCDLVLEVRSIDGEHQLLQLGGDGSYLLKYCLGIFGGALPFLNDGVCMSARRRSASASFIASVSLLLG